MKVFVDEITTETETHYLDGEKEKHTALLVIRYTLKLKGSHKLNGEIVVPYDDYKSMSLADHERQILELIILEAEHAKGV